MRSKKWDILTVGMALILTGGMDYSAELIEKGDRAIAQQNPLITKDENKKKDNYNPPTNGAPVDRRVTGSRPGCPNLKKTFTALVPTDHVGETVSERPTFWLYVPYASTVELILLDAANSRILHRQVFEVSNAPGAIGLTPNSEAPVLEPDRIYKWRFDFFCGSSSQGGMWQEEGLIIRRSRSLSVEGLTARERSDRYAENGFWYDALTELATLLQANPTDEALLRDWANWLQHPSVQLNDFVLDIPLKDDAIDFPQ